MEGVIRWFSRNHVAANFLMLAVVLAGGTTWFKLRKEIFPETSGKLYGIAVRVPLANASLTDCVFEVSEPTDAQTVNQALREAAAGRLAGILGVEDQPLVSSDYRGDTRSSIIDADSTMVIDGTHVKLLAWYDNEIGYVNRLMELVRHVARSL